MKYRILRALLVFAIFAGIGLAASGPATADHGNDYNPQNNDVLEERTVSGTVDVAVAWADPPNYLDACQIEVTNNQSQTYKYHPYLYKRSNNEIVWEGSQITISGGGGGPVIWFPTSGDIADVHEPYVKVVESTTGGGYVRTITMDPYQFLSDKTHTEWAYETQSWSPC